LSATCCRLSRDPSRLRTMTSHRSHEHSYSFTRATAPLEPEAFSHERPCNILCGARTTRRRYRSWSTCKGATLRSSRSWQRQLFLPAVATMATIMTPAELLSFVRATFAPCRSCSQSSARTTKIKAAKRDWTLPAALKHHKQVGLLEVSV